MRSAMHAQGASSDVRQFFLQASQSSPNRAKKCATGNAMATRNSAS